MQSENKPAKHRKSRAKRILKWTLIGIGALLVLVILIVPAYVSSDSFKRMVLSRINSSGAGTADFADLSMGWLKGVRIDNLTFDDEAGMVSVKVKQIATKPHYASIIAGNMSFGQTTIDQPRIEIKLKNKPPADDEAAAQTAGVPTEAAMIALVTSVVINDGSVKVTDAMSRTAELSNINSRISIRPPGEQSTLDLDMTLVAKAGSSKIHVEAGVTPTKAETGSPWTLKDSDGDLTIEIDNLDIESLEPFLALAGVNVQAKGSLSANLKSQIRGGQLANLTGKVTGSRIDIGAEQFKGDRLKTAVLNADIKLTRQDQMISIEKLTMKTDWANLNVSGTMPTTLKSLDSLLAPDSKSDLKGSFNCDLAALAAQMPKTLGLKEGTKIASGRISGNIRTSGQAGKKQIAADAELSDLKGTVGGKQVALSQPIKATALISTQKVSKDKSVTKFDELNVTAAFANVSCTGTTENLNYKANVDLAKFQSELGQFFDLGKYQMAGRLDANGQVVVKEDKTTVTGSADIRNLRLTSPDNLTATEPKADLDFTITIDKKENILALDSVIADTSFGRLSIKNGTVPLSEETQKPTNLVVNAAGIDLARLRPFAIMFGSFPKDMQISGVVESDLALSSAKKTYKIVTENTRIRNFELSFPEKKPFKQQEISLIADLELNTSEKTYTIKKLNLLSEQIKLTFAPARLSTENDTTTLVGKAELEYDWAAIGDMASSFLPPGLNLQGKRTTSINFASQYPADQTDKILANLNTNKCQFGFDQAGYMGLNIGPTDVHAQFENGVLTIDPFSSSVNNGTIEFAALADFKQDSPILKIPQPVAIRRVQINEQMTRELLKYINPIFANAVGVSGVVSFAASELELPLAGADQNDLKVVGAIAMDNIRLNPTGLLGQLLSLIGARDKNAVMKIHPTQFTLSDGILKYDNMQIDVGSTPLKFKGRIGLDKSLDMMVALPLGSLSKKLNLGDGTGSFTIWLPLTGTIDNPKLDTSKILEGQLQNTIKGLLNEDTIKGLLDEDTIKGLLDEDTIKGLLDGLFK